MSTDELIIKKTFSLAITKKMYNSTRSILESLVSFDIPNTIFTMPNTNLMHKPLDYWTKTEDINLGHQATREALIH